MTTSWYMSPEMVPELGGANYGRPTDIWAAGVTLLHLLGVGRHFKFSTPTDAESDRGPMLRALRAAMDTGDAALALFLFETPTALHSALRRMLDPDPAQRANVSDAIGLLEASLSVLEA
jgi:serine/threonine protein kinase